MTQRWLLLILSPLLLSATLDCPSQLETVVGPSASEDPRDLFVRFINTPIPQELLDDIASELGSLSPYNFGSSITLSAYDHREFKTKMSEYLSKGLHERVIRFIQPLVEQSKEIIKARYPDNVLVVTESLFLRYYLRDLMPSLYFHNDPYFNFILTTHAQTRFEDPRQAMSPGEAVLFGDKVKHAFPHSSPGRTQYLLGFQVIHP